MKKYILITAIIAIFGIVPINKAFASTNANHTIQPQIHSAVGYKSTWYGKFQKHLFTTNKSYRDTNDYFKLSEPIVVSGDVNWGTILGHTIKGGVNNTHLTYGFAWTDSAHNNLNFDRETTRVMTGWAQTKSSPKHIAPVFDTLRGRYVLVLAYVRNNDGISAISGMNVEVDDVIPMYFYIAPKH